MTFSSKEIHRWLNPWPIKLKRRRWKIIVVPLRSCAKLTCFWKVDGKRKTIGWWAKMAAKGKVPDERQHYIHILARFHVPVLSTITAIAVIKDGAWTVIDGNYHLIAALSVKKYGHERHSLKCPVTWVGLVIPSRQSFK